MASDIFLGFVIALFFLQALWIALSFRYPLIYDEIRHVPIIEIFSHNLSPLITSQPTRYDEYGSLNIASGFTASLYHYILSFPYRLVSTLTDDFMNKVLVLRVLNVSMVAGGIYVFARLFDRAGVRRLYTNIGLLLFTILPIVPFVAAHVNYDNMLFLLTAIFLLLSVRIVSEKQVSWASYSLLILVGCFASLVKYTFLPLFLASLLFLSYFVFRRYGASFFHRMKQSVLQSNKRILFLLNALTLVFVGFFSLVYIQNMLLYKTPRPACEQVMSVERCVANPVAKRNIEAEMTKNSRPIEQLPEYTLIWVENMILATNFSISAVTTEGVADRRAPLPVIYSLVFFGSILSAAIILYAWSHIANNTAWKLLILNSLFLIAIVFINNYKIYLDFHAAYAIQPRYLLSVVPIILIMTVVASAFVLRKQSVAVKMLVLSSVLVLSTQGGGAVTHILRSQNSWYRQDPYILSMNHAIKNVLAPFVKE